MPRISCGDVSLNYIEHGSGENVVLAIHGNLGCARWLDPVLPHLPSSLHIIAADWRGCGSSDKPEPEADFSNYAMEIHARDHLALLDQLGIKHCHLYAHSTGGIIVSRMLSLAPERFGKVLMLDPVSPLGLQLGEEQMAVLSAMKNSRTMAFTGMATAAPTLFRPESLAGGSMPAFAEATNSVQREAFARIIDNTRDLSDGIWFGTPRNLAREWESGELAKAMLGIKHQHLILFGKLDGWIPRDHLLWMTEHLANARLEEFPYIGHSMNIEQPLLLARIFDHYFNY